MSTQRRRHRDTFTIGPRIDPKDEDLELRQRKFVLLVARAIDRREAGYENGNIDDIPVLTGVVRIGLVYHGTNALTHEHLVLLGSKR
jgi:hypothetical protein